MNIISFNRKPFAPTDRNPICKACSVGHICRYGFSAFYETREELFAREAEMDRVAKEQPIPLDCPAES